MDKSDIDEAIMAKHVFAKKLLGKIIEKYRAALKGEFENRPQLLGALECYASLSKKKLTDLSCASKAEKTLVDLQRIAEYTSRLVDLLEDLEKLHRE